MLGSDCEQILSGINAIKNELVAGIHGLASATQYQIETMGTHGELEVPVPIDSSAFTGGAINSLASIYSELGKVKSMRSDHYASVNSFNNSYGSPWQELEDMEEAVTHLQSYGTLNFVGEKAALLGDMNAALSEVVDAKHAFIYYQDYIQRGFDTMFNGNQPSVTFDGGVDDKTIGNVKQEYEENVRIPTPSHDPF